MHLSPRLFPLFALAFLSGGCASGPASGAATAPAADSSDVSSLEAREGEDFVVFTGEGRRVTLDDVLDAAVGADVLLLGEEHDDPMTHRLQLELLRRAWERWGGGEGASPPAAGTGGGPAREGPVPEARAGEALVRERARAALARETAGEAPAGEPRPLVLSLEMFERDVQDVLDEYLAGVITEEHLRAGARPWANYRRDYRPLVELARTHGLPVVAANAPRRYVNRASRLGRDSLESLSPVAKQTLAPLPYPEPSLRYRAQWDSLMGAAASHTSASALDGQTLWDATMAHSLRQALERWPGALVLHLAGSFHVERGTGIPEVLAAYRPQARTLAVVFKPTQRITTFDRAKHLGYGDFVVLTAVRRVGRR